MVIIKPSDSTTQAHSLLRSYITVLEGKPEPQEQDVLTVLQHKRPTWVAGFPAAMSEARRGILSRLLNAMVREDLFGFAKKQIIITQQKGSWQATGEVNSHLQDLLAGELGAVLGKRETGLGDEGCSERVKESREPLYTNTPLHWRLYPLHAPGADFSLLALPVAREFGYSRLTFAGKPLHVRRIGRRPLHVRALAHPVELLKLWRNEALQSGDPALDTLDRFAEEVCNSSANLALALCGARVRQTELQAEAQAAGHDTLLGYIETRRQQDDSFSPLLCLESWTIDGHPTHPGTKMKLGMPTADLLDCAPEFAASPALRFAAVHRDLLETQSLDESTFTERLLREHPEAAREAETLLAKKGLSLRDFHIVPLHPWQLKHAVPAIYGPELEAGLILPLEAQSPTTATLSFRTLAPKDLGLSHVKTAVNVVATSTVRTISPNSAHNGPLLSAVLREIHTREGGFGGTFEVVPETAGCAYRFAPSGPVQASGLTDEEQDLKRRNLSALLRDNFEAGLSREELAVSACSLTLTSPLSGQPFALELIQRFQREQGITDQTEAAVGWMQTYAEVALPGFLTLLTRYGIGLEGHQQNSVMVFLHGRPVRMIQRDFGGVRLQAQGLLPALYPGSMTLVEDEEEMRCKLFHAVYQGQLGEMILTLAQHCDIPSRLFWQPVRDVSRRVLAELKQDPAIAAQAAADETALFAEQLPLKALTRMRLDLPCANRQYTLEKVQNPLVAAK